MVGPDSLVDYYTRVFELEVREVRDTPAGVLHRLTSPGATLKVMVPLETPEPGDSKPFLGVQGVRYLTMWVDDLDATIERSAAHGGKLVQGPFEYRPGTRLAILQDPVGTSVEVVQS